MSRLRTLGWVMGIGALAGCADHSGPAALADLPLQPTVLPAEIQVSAEIRPAGAAAAVWLRFTNPGPVEDTVVYGPCSFAVVLGASAGAASRVWQSVSSEGSACDDIASLLPVGAASARTVLAGRVAASGNVPEPPDGRWCAAAVLLVNDLLMAVPGGAATLPFEPGQTIEDCGRALGAGAPSAGEETG